MYVEIHIVINDCLWSKGNINFDFACRIAARIHFSIIVASFCSIRVKTCRIDRSLFCSRRQSSFSARSDDTPFLSLSSKRFYLFTHLHLQICRKNK